MIRVLIFLVIVAAFALGAVWLADRPGDVTIVWLGQRIETSVMVLVFAVATTAIAAIMVWSVLRALLRSPRRVAHALKGRRVAKGQRAISRGLIAVGSGNIPAARRYAGEAKRLAPSEPLALLLAAQSAQLAGDRDGAQRAFRAMAGHDDTRLIGLHGLFAEAQWANDGPSARLYAEEAAAIAPTLPWAAQAVLDYRAAEGDWNGALAALEGSLRSGVISKAAYRRQRGVLLTALATGESDREVAKAAVLEAVKLAPDLVGASVAAGRMLTEARETRRAARILEAAWRLNPHPDIADAYADLHPGDSAQARFARMRTLEKLRPDSDEGTLAAARAALDAQEFAQARAILAPLAVRPTQRVAMLMAELEERESGDIGRARQWTSRAVHAARDPAWTADGVVSDIWMPVSPVTGRLDAFEWKQPLPELAHKGPSLEVDRWADADVERLPSAPPPPFGVPATLPDDAPAVNEQTAVAPLAAASDEPPTGSKTLPHEPVRPSVQSFPRQPMIKPVIPLVHAPDDPGTDADQEPETPPPNWQKMRSLFR